VTSTVSLVPPTWNCKGTLAAASAETITSFCSLALNGRRLDAKAVRVWNQVRDGIVPAVVRGRGSVVPLALVGHGHLGVRDRRTLGGSVTVPMMLPYTACPPYRLRRQCHQTNANHQHRGHRDLFRHFFSGLRMCSLVKICRTIAVRSSPGGPREASGNAVMPFLEAASGMHSHLRMKLLPVSAKVNSRGVWHCQYVNGVLSII